MWPLRNKLLYRDAEQDVETGTIYRYFPGRGYISDPGSIWRFVYGHNAVERAEHELH